MTYNPNIPQGEPSPATQQSQILTNFSQLASIFANNHTAFNGPNQGDHESIIFTLQTQDPGVTQDLTVLYSKNATSAVDTQPQLFLQIPQFLPTTIDTTVAPNSPMQLTYNSVNTSGPTYQSFLVGGYLLYFGSTMFSSNVITLSPLPTQILTAIAIPNNLNSAGLPNTVSTIATEAGANPQTITINSTTAQPTDTFTWVGIAIA